MPYSVGLTGKKKEQTMIDNYIKTKFPHSHNVFKRVPTAEPHMERHQPDKLRVHPSMQLLIAKLLTHNPRWEFIAVDYPSSDNSLYTHKSFNIECDGEELGEVNCDLHWRTGETKYEFDCPRLKAKRQKSTTPHTKDLNKAVKSIIGHMYNRTPAERLSTARQLTASIVGRAMSIANYEYRQAQEKLLPHMTRFVEQCWADFSAIRMDAAEAKMRDTLLPKRDALADVGTISDPANTDKGYILLEAGASFIVGRYNLTEAPAVMRLDEMPDRLKGSLGMLKLLEPKKYAPGIGMRIDEVTYYVVDADE
jgi:hypothetical protein